LYIVAVDHFDVDQEHNKMLNFLTFNSFL